jgi:hypothetical protein
VRGGSAYGWATAALLALAVVTPGCGGRSPPTQLVDGTPTRPPSVELEIDRPQIAARVRVVDPATVRRGRIGRCLAGVSERPGPGAMIERTGVEGSSVTFHTMSGRDVVACDGTSPRLAWCGRALGHLHGGRLRDPRLDIAGCSTATGDPVAFAWIEPARRAKFVAIRQDGYVEVYAVAGGVPVRVATTKGIDPATSSGRFEVSEHDGTGRRLRSYVLDARVAG